MRLNSRHSCRFSCTDWLIINVLEPAPMPMVATFARVLCALICALSIVACGSGNIEPKSHLRSDSRNGAIALSDESPASTVYVRVNSNAQNLGICLLESADCVKTTTKLLPMTNVKGPFWRSQSPVIIRTHMTISVVEELASERKILLSGKISRKENSSTTQDIAPTGDITPPRLVSNAAVTYDFAGTLSRDSSQAAVVRMILNEGKFANSIKVKVKGTVVNLRNSAVKIPLEREVEVADKGVVDFTLKGLDPDTVYRIDNVTIEDATQGTPIKIKDSYFVSTTDDSKISKSRRRLVIRALKEAYEWDHGMYDTNLGYAAYGGWCDRFYTWAAGLEFKVKNQYSAQSFFKQYNSLGDANRIPELGVCENLAGDFIRYEGTSQGTHTFMVVAYDVATKQLWAVEGNYNNRVMRNQRKIYSPWMHGHLVEDQAR
jgi:hypothetical protein